MSANPPASPAGKTIVIVDDGVLHRQCVAAQLMQHGLNIHQAWDVPTLLQQVDGSIPDVILLNIATPDSATLLQLGLDLDPGCRIIVFGLSIDREPEIIAGAEAGVAGLHLRTESFEHLLSLIQSAGDGRAQCSPEVSAILLRRVYAFAAHTNPDANASLLTRREIEILDLIEQGLTNQQIATRLSLTVHTVKNHVHNMLSKLGVGTRSEAVTVFRATKYASQGI